MSVSGWNWQAQQWIAPDGKVVPFHQADVTRLVIPNAPQLAEIDHSNFEDWPEDGPDSVRVEVSRWARKYKVAVVVETDDGQGGVDIQDLYVSVLVIRLGDYPIAEFEANVDDILLRVRAYLEARNLA
jgi:hypothetical protein